MAAYKKGSTIIHPKDFEGLILQDITTQQELNDHEAANIAEARTWVFLTRRTRDTLSISFLRRLHKEMFGKVWSWAGHWRTRMTNLGIDPHRLPIELQRLFHDVRYWHEHKVYSTDEIAVRLHHKLVWIHPFRNGNGRCARLLADIYLFDQGLPMFTWGRAKPNVDESARDRYIKALRQADNHDFTALIEFVRS